MSEEGAMENSDATHAPALGDEGGLDGIVLPERQADRERLGAPTTRFT